MFCEPRAKRIRGMRYCMSKHINVSRTSILKMENVFEKSDQISYSCKAETPHTSIFKVENVFEKSDQISYSCKAGNPLQLQRKYKDKRILLEPSKVRRTASLQFEDAL